MAGYEAAWREAGLFLEEDLMGLGKAECHVPPEKVRRLAAELLELAAERFSNHGCNDLKRPSYFTKEEWLQLAKDYEQWNSNGQDPATPLGDWSAMNWCSILLAKGLV